MFARSVSVPRSMGGLLVDGAWVRVDILNNVTGLYSGAGNTGKRTWRAVHLREARPALGSAA